MREICPLEEERICELQPIGNVADYYKQSFLGFLDPRNEKEYFVKWIYEKDDDGRELDFG